MPGHGAQYTTAHGHGLQRSLPGVYGALRHYECCFAEEPSGALAPESRALRYVGVSDAALYVVERAGEAPRVASVPLEDVTNVEFVGVPDDIAASVTDAHVAEHMSCIRVEFVSKAVAEARCRAQAAAVPTQGQAGEAQREERRGVMGRLWASVRSKGGKAVGDAGYGRQQPGRVAPQLVKQQTQRRQLAIALRSPRKRAVSVLGFKSAEANVARSELMITTIEPSTLVGFYLIQSWHAKQAESRIRAAALAGGGADPAYDPELHLEEHYSHAQLRELFAEIEQAVLSCRSVYDVASRAAEAIEELGCACRYSPLLKQLFFRSDRLRMHLYHRAAAWAALAGAGNARSEGEEVDDAERVDVLKYYVEPEAPPLPEETARLIAARAARLNVDTRSKPSSEERAATLWARLLRAVMRRLSSRLLLQTLRCVARVLAGSEGVVARRQLARAPKPYHLGALLSTMLAMPPLSGQRAHAGRGFHAGAAPARPAVGLDHTADSALHMSVGKGERVWSAAERAREEAAGGHTALLLAEAASSDDTVTDLVAELLVAMDDLAAEAQACGEDVQEGVDSAAALDAMVDRRLAGRRVRLLFERTMALLLGAGKQGADSAEPLAGLRLYRAARALRLLVGEGMGVAAEVLREDFEEELRYLLASPSLERQLGAQPDFFVQQARPLLDDVRRIVLDAAWTNTNTLDELPLPVYSSRRAPS